MVKALIKNIFGKRELDKQSSLEQLDDAVRITTPLLWLIGIGILLIFCLVLLWGFWGNAPQTVEGKGILLRKGGIFQVESISDGRLLELNVNVGDNVTEGQVVGKISQQEMELKLQLAKESLELTKSRQQESDALFEKQAQSFKELQEGKRAGLEKSIEVAKENLVQLDKRMEVNKKLLEQGLISTPIILKMIEEKQTLERNLGDLQSQIEQLHVQQIEFEQTREKDLFQSDNKIRDMQHDIDTLIHSLNSKSQIVVPHSGRVLEIRKKLGSLVHASETILSLEFPDKPLEAVVFVPTAEGKKIKQGMDAQVFLSTIHWEEYGYLLGNVSEVSLIPLSAEAMLSILGSKELVQNLTLPTGPPFAVTITLKPNPSTYSGYSWSSESGPDIKLEGGTAAQAKIIIVEERPIEILFPFFKTFIHSSEKEK